jgi:uncharacterized membrane protein
MSWFFIALVGPVLYAVCNHIDKHLLEKYFKGGQVGAATIFSALFGVVALPFIYLFAPAVMSLGTKSIAILVLSGALNVGCLILYLNALRDEEASVVVPFYQTIPIFGYLLGYVVLRETLDRRQLFACALIIAGTMLLSVERHKAGFRLKKKVAALMLCASFIYAVVGVVFKMVAVEDGFWPSVFWNLVGTGAVGFLLLGMATSYRRQFLSIFKFNGPAVVSLNVLNEALFLVAETASAYATLLAPIALVMTVNGFQPFFVFVFELLIAFVFYPKAKRESVSAAAYAQKIAAIGSIVLGTSLLALTGAL